VGVIDAILADDRQRPAKQRHTAKRIFERLKAEHGFTGGYTIMKDYVHPAGEAQADFGEALVVIAGVEQKAHYLAMDLPQSDDCFVTAFPAETTEAFLEGHRAGSLPRRMQSPPPALRTGGPNPGRVCALCSGGNDGRRAALENAARFPHF